MTITARPRGAMQPAGSHILHIAAPVAGLYAANNKTPLSRVSGTGHFTCPVCGIGFTKPWAWAKRATNVYCGRGCANAAQRVEVETVCRVCGKVEVTNPSIAAWKRTCSAPCSRQWRKTNQQHKIKSSGFMARVRERLAIIRTCGMCAGCGRTHGPWIVRGLGEDCDTAAAKVLCRDCYIEDLTGAKVWTQAEDDLIRAEYQGGKKLQDRLPGRTLSAIYSRACMLGVTR